MFSVLACLQTSEQGFAKEVMQAIPAPLCIERDQEKIGPFQQPLVGCRVGLPRDHLPEICRDAAQDRAVEYKVLQRWLDVSQEGNNFSAAKSLPRDGVSVIGAK